MLHAPLLMAHRSWHENQIKYSKHPPPNSQQKIRKLISSKLSRAETLNFFFLRKFCHSVATFGEFLASTFWGFVSTTRRREEDRPRRRAPTDSKWMSAAPTPPSCTATTTGPQKENNHKKKKLLSCFVFFFSKRKEQAQETNTRLSHDLGPFWFVARNFIWKFK